MKELKSLVPLLSLSTGWQTKIDFSVTFKFSSNLRFNSTIPVQTSFVIQFESRKGPRKGPEVDRKWLRYFELILA